MNKKTFTSFIVTACALALALPNAAQANVTVYQHQTSSSNIEIECSGDCSAKSETSQSQTQRVGEPVWHRENYGSRANWRNHQLTNGYATVTWPHRGGTCTVRYTEAAARWYKYTTAAACDAGEATIGGLIPGRAYRFQVRQGSSNWERPVRLIAW